MFDRSFQKQYSMGSIPERSTMFKHVVKHTMITPNVHIHKNKRIINCPNNNVRSEKYFKKGGKFKNCLTSITRGNINVGKD